MSTRSHGFAALARRRGFLPTLALLPTIVVLCVCFIGGIVWTGVISLTPSSMVPRFEFAGLLQYERLFNTQRWLVAYGNMFIFGALVIGGTLTLGTLLAIVIDNKVRGESVFRTALLYPLSMSYIVTGLVWESILSPAIGVQSFVQKLGWSSFTFDWLIREDKALYCLVFGAIWHHAGLIMVVMLSGLRNFDPLVWRAAKIDGISRPQTYLHIVLPAMRPIIVTCVILLTIQVVRSYDLVVALTGGGPGFASDLPGKFVVDYAFERGNVGLASAAAITMLFSVLAVLAPYFWLELRRKKA